MNYFKIIIAFFLFLLNKTSLASENIVEILKNNNNIIFIRHAIAPGNGDPSNFDISDCSTQRNLSKEGELQAFKIGKFFRENDIKVMKVLSSEWCRCKDTAKIAFESYETKNFLNSFYDDRFSENKDKQILDLKKFIRKWDYTKNLVLVTHYVVISEILDVATSSGEIVITDKNLKFISSLKIN
tara:strand:+ start:44 stop:595 length:552 start_codon:yes stop_codon:yes gene_type:complete